MKGYNMRTQEQEKKELDSKCSETCNEQLERMVKNIAEDITDGLKIDDTSGTGTVSEFMDHVYNIEWITHQDHSYKAARLLVAGGGPNIWVNLMTNTVDGYWGADKRSYGFVDNIGLDEYLQEIHDDR